MNLFEKIFILKFIAGLKKLGVESIPISGNSFQQGAIKMRELLHVNPCMEGKYAKDLEALLFQNEDNGSFPLFQDAIGSQNGELLNVLSPYYCEYRINIDNQDADNLLELENINTIDNNCIINLARAFCEGAGIQ